MENKNILKATAAVCVLADMMAMDADAKKGDYQWPDAQEGWPDAATKAIETLANRPADALAFLGSLQGWDAYWSLDYIDELKKQIAEASGIKGGPNLFAQDRETIAKQLFANPPSIEKDGSLGEAADSIRKFGNSVIPWRSYMRWGTAEVERRLTELVGAPSETCVMVGTHVPHEMDKLVAGSLEDPTQELLMPVMPTVLVRLAPQGAN